MLTTQTIIIDLLKPRENVMHVVQEDSTRHIRLILLENNEPFNPAANLNNGENLLTFVEFRKPDGHGGIYDTTSLGEPAVALEDEGGNDPHIFIVALDGQCFTCPGWTQINVRFETESGKRIHTFAINVDVEPTASSDTESTDWDALGSIADLRNALSAIVGDVDALTDQADTGVMLRSTLEAGTDMDTVVQPGMYHKSVDIALVNAPPNSERRARIVVFGGGSSIAVVQVWIVTATARIWYRTKAAVNSAWSSWERLVNFSNLEAALETTMLLRSALTSGTDMDTIIQPGMYYKAAAVSLVNAPTDSATRARIAVFGGGSETSVVQMWYNTSDNKIFFRMKSADLSAWAAWEQLVGASDLATAVALRGEIAENTDMDTVVQPGMYHKAASISISNAPPDSATRARVIVFGGGNSIAVVQVWAVTRNARIWYRTKSAINSEWSDWNEVANMAALNSAIETALTLRTAPTDGTDMDTIITPGMYYKAPNVALVNAPTDSATRARIVIFGGGGETSVVQMWYATAENKIWYRMKSGADAAWSPWVCAANTLYGNGDRYPGPAFARAADVYAALDALEASSGGRITHTELTESLDSIDLPEGETANDNKMRLYKINLMQKHMTTDEAYQVSNTPMFQKPKAFITSCIHGNEKASAVYVVDFVRRLLGDPDFNSIASAMEWYIIPVVNVYGFNRGTRHNAPTEQNASGYDINRDFSDEEYLHFEKPYGFKTVEARAVKQVYLDNKFAFYLDVHQAAFPRDTPRCGFCSAINEDQSRLADYKRLWQAIDRAGYAAQIWMQNDPNTLKTSEQITFNWGEETNPPLGENSTACATAYIRGNTHWNTHVAEQNPVFGAGVVETNKRCTLISGSDLDYNRVALTFGAVYVQSLIKELVSTILEHFDVYD